MIKPNYKLLAIIILLIPIVSFGQLSKQWEFYLPSGHSVQPSFYINSSNHLKTLQVDEESFVVLGSKQKESWTFGYQIYLFKFNTKGEIIWEFTYDHSPNINEFPYDFTIDNEGNIYVVGTVTTFYQPGYEGALETSNYLLMKLSPEADVIWEKEIEDQDYFVNYGSSVIVDSEGDIYTIGKIVENDINHVILHKYNSEGNEIYSKKVNTEIPYSLKINNDLLYVVTRKLYSESSVFRYDLSGELVDTFDVDLGRNKPVFDQDCNMYTFFSSIGDFGLNKYDSEGNFQWTYHKETNLPSNVKGDELIDCVIDDEGNVFVTGRYYGEHYGDTTLYTNCDILTSKLDSEGNIIWEDIYNYDNRRSCQIGKNIELNEEGNIYVLGYQSIEKNGNIFASRDMVMLKYNEDGERIDSFYHNGPSDREDYGLYMIMQEDTIYVLGYSQNEDSSFDYNVIKYSPKIIDGIHESEFRNVFVYPNPSDGQYYVKCDSKVTEVKVFDKLGRLVFFEDSVDCNTNIDLSKRQSGIYYMTYIADGINYSEPIILRDQ